MTDKELANSACDDGFKEGVQNMIEILLQGWITAQTPAERKQTVQRFQNGLGIYKDAYQSAKKAIDAVFS
ncbi:MAG TPA: hypothetical protein VFB68_13680 [Xanthobacteraceae bacterium]|nr:hypothetical protein [Xanthobacteraceae bacterium]HZO46942.1 hypothetical protein [Xanthobacteraceae bacterium]